ncbi:hypothetical protein HKD37_16G045741 [Glycine soja]
MSRFGLGIHLINYNFTNLYSSLLLVPNSLMYSTRAPAWSQILNYLPDTQSLGHIDTSNQH